MPPMQCGFPLHYIPLLSRIKTRNGCHSKKNSFVKLFVMQISGAVVVYGTFQQNKVCFQYIGIHLLILKKRLNRITDLEDQAATSGLLISLLLY